MSEAGLSISRRSSGASSTATYLAGSYHLPQNYPLQLSGTMPKVVIAVRLLEEQHAKRAIARL